MKISVCQIYVEPGASFPFTHKFQARIGSLLTATAQPQEPFKARFGEEYDLIFNMSAKHDLDKPEVKGPAVFKRWKTVEYTVFLPFNINERSSADLLRTALSLMFVSIRDILLQLGMSCAAVEEDRDTTIADILRDKTMTIG